MQTRSLLTVAILGVCGACATLAVRSASWAADKSAAVGAGEVKEKGDGGKEGKQFRLELAEPKKSDADTAKQFGTASYQAPLGAELTVLAFFNPKAEGATILINNHRANTSLTFTQDPQKPFWYGFFGSDDTQVGPSGPPRLFTIDGTVGGKRLITLGPTPLSLGGAAMDFYPEDVRFPGGTSQNTPAHPHGNYQDDVPVGAVGRRKGRERAKGTSLTKPSVGGALLNARTN